MFAVVVFNMVPDVYGASAPKRSAPKPSRSYTKRELANVYFNQGRKLQDQGKFKRAAQKYRQAVQTDPRYAEAYSNLGFTYRKQGAFDKAINAYKKAIRLDPKLAEAHEYLGEAYAEIGKYDLAGKELKILRELESDEAGELDAFISKMKAK